MVYSFYDPEYRRRSIGAYMILDHIARARRMGLAYVYLGYWVRDSRKMDYKGRFLPQQRLLAAGRTGCDDGGDLVVQMKRSEVRDPGADPAFRFAHAGYGIR